MSRYSRLMKLRKKNILGNQRPKKLQNKPKHQPKVVQQLDKLHPREQLLFLIVMKMSHCWSVDNDDCNIYVVCIITVQPTGF